MTPAEYWQHQYEVLLIAFLCVCALTLGCTLWAAHLTYTVRYQKCSYGWLADKYKALGDRLKKAMAATRLLRQHRKPATLEANRLISEAEEG